MHDHVKNWDVFCGNSIVLKNWVTDEQKTNEKGYHEKILEEKKSFVDHLRADVST